MFAQNNPQSQNQSSSTATPKSDLTLTKSSSPLQQTKDISKTKPETFNLPPVPSLWKSLGPSFVLLGLALGSGELILWPYLASQWGLGLLWGAVLGVSLQYILNTEVIRYTLATGESVFVGWRRLWRGLPVWFILSTFIPWAIPGFSSAVAEILHYLLPLLNQTVLAIGTLLLAGVILSTGQVYKTLERWQTRVILITVPIIFLMAIGLASSSDWVAMGVGLLGYGEGWRWFPPAVGLLSFLGAFAYAGAGGNLNLGQSYNILEKGFGMAHQASKVQSAFDLSHPHKLSGHLFTQNLANSRRWGEWWRLVTHEHLLIFWALGIVSIALLSLLAYVTVGTYGSQVSGGISFLLMEAEVIGELTAPALRWFFLIMSMILLFSSQLGVLSSSARIIAENVILLTHPLSNSVKMTAGFYIALWSQIGLGVVIILAGFSEPRLLITMAAVLNAAAMMVSFGLILWLNQARLPQAIRPQLWRKAVLVLGALSFLILLAETIRANVAL